ncbi:MAG: mucoidy inhibitor MuiA family protein, partial [Beijerinckiaceae bacterium]
GATSIVFRGLPQGLDPNSLRVQAQSAGQLAIGSVATRIAPYARPAMPQSLAEKLRSLTNERALMHENLRALQARKEMIERYSKASPEKLGEKAAPMKVEDWSKAWTAVGEGLAKVAEEVQAAQIRLREIQKEIQALQASNRDAGAGAQPRRDVTVDVEAGAAGKARLTLTYRVAGARWLPVYDARLDSGKDGAPSIELVRRAAVSQRSGEDWTGVTLTVSTVRARRGTQAPDVLAQILDFYKPPPPPRPMAESVAAPAAAPMRKSTSNIGVLGMAKDRMAAQSKSAAEPEATVDAGPYEAQFRVPGKVDLKGDGSERVLRIATSKIVPELSARAAPAFDATAYLEAQFVNSDAAPLLPGIVNLHRDGLYAGRGALKLVAPGEKAVLGFGADDNVKIRRVPERKVQQGPGWIGNTRTETTDFTTKVTNLHPFAIKVRILDRMPVSEDDAIVVKGLPTNTTPGEEKVDGKRGVVAWNFSLKPKEEKTLRFGWRVEWPNGKRIVPRTSPN